MDSPGRQEEGLLSAFEMKKGKGASESTKVVFGKRREGKHQKSSGPKDGKVKKYKGQGR